MFCGCRGLQRHQRHGRMGYGLAARKLKVTWRHSAASGQTLASARRLTSYAIFPKFDT